MSIMTIPNQTPAAAHPTWCDPRCCTTYTDTDGTLLVVHRVVVLDKPGMKVEARRGDEIDQRGRVVCTDAGEVIVDVHGGSVLDPTEAVELAGAVAAAAAHAAGIGAAADLDERAVSSR